MHARNRRLAWLIGLGMSAALFALIALFFFLFFCQNDDVSIIRCFMGFEIGAPASFHIFIHGLLARPIHWLALRFPTVAWFSVFQVGLLFLGCVALLKSIVQCALKAGIGLAGGSLLALVSWLLFLFPYCVQLTFTQTAAILGAAAAMQIMSLEHGRPARVVGGMLLATLLAVLAYALRQDALMPVLAFCGVAFVFVFFTEYGLGRAAKRAARPMLISLLIAAVALGGMLGWRAVETARCGDADYLAWEDVSTILLDQCGLDGLPQEALDEVGWSANTALLVGSDWFFLDESISTEAMRTLAGYALDARDNSLTGLFTRASGVVSALWEGSQPQHAAMLAAAALALMSLLAAALAGRGRRGWLLGAAGLTLAAAGLMAMYLSMVLGRMPLRAALLMLLPAEMLLLAVFLRAAGCRERGGKRAFAALVCVLAVFCGFSLCAEAPRLLPDEAAAAELGDPNADLMEYALYNGDMFIIHDLTLLCSRDLFPDVSEGLPHNVTLWGGWNLRSPESAKQFAAYGIDLAHFQAETFLREDVLFATAVVDPPPNRLLSYLREKVDPNVDCLLYGENGFAYFYQFYIP